MKLYLVRHGAVTPKKEGVFYGGTEVPLSDFGIMQAQAAGVFLSELPIQSVLASPLARAQFGAQCLLASRKGMLLQTREDFMEIDRGRWVGLRGDEVRELFPGDLEAHQADLEGWRGHGGESLGALRDRVLRAIYALESEFSSDAAVAIVCHMFPVKAVFAAALGLELSQWADQSVPTGSVSEFQLEAGVLRYLRGPICPPLLVVP